MFARASYYLEPQLFALACRPRRFHYHWYTGRPPKTHRQRRHPHTHHVHGVYVCVLPPTLVGAMSSYSTPSWVSTQPVRNLHGSSHLEKLNEGMSLREQMQKKADAIYEDLLHRETDESAVFTNSELSLKHVDVYGFDFDYTLVHYTTEVNKLIYELARDRLVEKLNYPSQIKGIKYDPDFAIRGLHCDIKNGFLMKIDTYNHIQLNSVYRGHFPVSADEVLEHYGGTHVPMHVMDRLPSSGNWKLTQFLDLFSIPEATLLADVLQYFIDCNIPFDSEYLFEDVQNTVYEVHHHGDIHRKIVTDLGRYLQSNPQLPQYLHRLKDSCKKLFLITNSPYWFVDQGMRHALQTSDWRDLFNVIIVGARKPSFYSDSNRPFRSLNSASMTPTWWRVTQLKPGEVYEQGNVNDFIHMTGWKGSRVLYIGDHVFSDLADPILQHGWKTGAIIPELEAEIVTSNGHMFKKNLARLLALESLLLQKKDGIDPELYEQLKEERKQARSYLKKAHNCRFGSVFRTEKSPTYFSRRLATFSNLYMSSVDHLMNYPLHHTFIPRRASLPHELDLNFDAVDPGLQ